MDYLNEYQKSQMNPRIADWLISLVLVVIILGVFGSIETKDMQAAQEHKKEAIAAAKEEAAKRQAEEKQKIDLYGKGQYMTGFGGLQSSGK